MNHKYSALALAALAMGAVALSTTEASAMLKDPGSRSTTGPASPHDWPDEGSGYPGFGATSEESNNPGLPLNQVAALEASSSSDENEFQGVQLGASALGGAGVAFGGMWLYRRRNLLAG